MLHEIVSSITDRNKERLVCDAWRCGRFDGGFASLFSVYECLCFQVCCNGVLLSPVIPTYSKLTDRPPKNVLSNILKPVKKNTDV